MEAGGVSMWFWSSQKKQPDRRELEIQRLKKTTLEKIDHATDATKQLNDKLEKEGGVTELIFLATGGDRRK